MAGHTASALPPLRLSKAVTTHRRTHPFHQSFTYKLALIDLDIDRLDETNRASPLFSIDRTNLFAFYRRDHGARTLSPLRPWAEARYKAAGIDLKSGTIRLLTVPRHLSYKFAPISLWLGYDASGEPAGVIYEVNNTFGDRHAYVAPLQGGTNHHNLDKRMYVSPFFDVSGTYKFQLSLGVDHLTLKIENWDDGQCVHKAILAADFHPATTGALLKTALTRPFSSHGITAGIHWEALKLWLKGAGYRAKPHDRHAGVSTHGSNTEKYVIRKP